MNRSLY